MRCSAVTTTDTYTQELERIFSATADKREAHDRARGVLADMAGDREVVTDALRRRIRSSGGLCRSHYPVVSLDVVSTPNVDIVLNCWIPLADRATDVTTKAIHHHGPLLLTTTTAFGPGYDHWLFTPPELIDPERERFTMDVIERGPHPLHHQAFVDANVAHVPMFVSDLTITLACWSTSSATTWRDRVKRVPALQRNSSRLRRLATRAGLASALELKNVVYFDFYPGDEGFVGMRDRKEFDLGPTADYLQSLLHVVQRTGNEDLASDIAADAVAPSDRPLFDALRAAMHAGEPIEAVLSEGHHDVPFANFTRDDIERALAHQATT